MSNLMRTSGRILANNAVGLVALVMAMGGTAYAAAKITSAQIANNTITSVDVKDQALTGKDIKNGSIAAADLAKGLAKPGANGAPGANGPKGADGANGINATGALIATNRSSSPSAATPPAFAGSLVPAGSSSTTFTTTVPGDLLVLANDGLASVTISSSLNNNVAGKAALFLDGVAVPGSAYDYTAAGGTLISGIPVGNVPFTKTFAMHQAVLRDVPSGFHLLQVRYTTNNAGATTANATVGADYTIVELG